MNPPYTTNPNLNQLYVRLQAAFPGWRGGTAPKSQGSPPAPQNQGLPAGQVGGAQLQNSNFAANPNPNPNLTA
jgi:hypothetical protein